MNVGVMKDRGIQRIHIEWCRYNLDYKISSLSFFFLSNVVVYYKSKARAKESI
jgi:hypothetical protein